MRSKNEAAGVSRATREAKCRAALTFLFADHEAGHAVVAAYLRVPFRYVLAQGYYSQKTVSNRVTLAYEPRVRRFSYDRRTDSMHERPKAEIDRELHRQIRNQAIVTLGARAAVDAMGTNFPSDIVGNKKALRVCAKMIGIRGTEFQSWRDGLLKVARDIISIPHVMAAIHLVSLELRYKGRMSAKQVHDELRRCISPPKAAA